MAHTKVSQSPNLLALLLVWLASGACAVPMGPLMGFGIGGSGLLGPAGFGAKQNSIGRSYSCGASFGSCARGQEEHSMIWVKEPTMLSAVTRTIANGQIDSMKAVIKDPQAARQNNNQHRAHGPALGKAGLGAGYGLGLRAGLGGLGFAGGFGSYGLMGALGGLGGLYGGMGMGMGNEPRLDLNLEVVINQLDKPLDVLLVFTSAVNQDLCTPDSLGPALTGPRNSMMNGGRGGFASPLMMHHGAGAGSLGAGGLGMFPGRPGTENLEREFGVIAQLRVQQGSNSFKINGLGEFRRLKDLAGHGMALCEDMVMGMGEKPVCTGKTFKVLFCSRLGYSIVEPMLMPAEQNGDAP